NSQYGAGWKPETSLLANAEAAQASVMGIFLDPRSQALIDGTRLPDFLATKALGDGRVTDGDLVRSLVQGKLKGPSENALRVRAHQWLESIDPKDWADSLGYKIGLLLGPAEQSVNQELVRDVLAHFAPVRDDYERKMLASFEHSVRVDA